METLFGLADGINVKLGSGNVTNSLISEAQELQHVVLSMTSDPTNSVISRVAAGITLKRDLRKDNTQQNKWLMYLEGVEPLPYILETEDSFDPEDEFLVSIDKRKVTPEIWSAQESLMLQTSKVHGGAHPVNSLLTLMLSIGPQVRKYCATRMLRHFIDLHEGDEPFVWGGGLVSVKFHNMAPKICQLLMNAIHYEHHFVHVKKAVSPNLFCEILTFLVHNPVIRARKMKSMLELFNNSYGCMSDTGVFPLWNGFSMKQPRPTLSGYSVGTMEGRRTDEFYFRYVEKGLLRDHAALIDANLPLTAATVWSMLSEQADELLAIRFTFMISIFHWPGFSRSNAPISHFKQTSVKPKVDDPFHNLDIEQVWDDFARFVYDSEARRGRSGFMPYDLFRKTLFRFLTSKSSGGYKVLASVELKDFRDPTKVGKEYNFRFTDKLTNFLANPEFFLEPEEALRGYYFMDKDGVRVPDSEVAEYEGKTSAEIREWMERRGIDRSRALKFAERVVTGGKQTRAVNPKTLGNFIYEIVLGVVLDEYLNHDEDFKATGTAYDFSNFTATGNTLIDHGIGIACSCRDDIIQSAQDFSAFDGTQHSTNMRNPALRAVTKRMSLMSDTAPWGKISGGMVELLTRLWGHGVTTNAHAISDNGVSVRVVLLDILQSGEFTTLSMNNMTNRAQFLALKRVLALHSTLMKKMEIFKIEYVGDDRETFIKVSPDFGTQDLAEFLSVTEEVASKSDLSLNTEKSVTRFYLYEYLKVRAFYGFFIANVAIQAFETEREAGQIDPINDARSYAGLLLALSAREGGDALWSKVCFYRFLLRSEYRMRTRDRDSTLKLYPNPGIYFVPLQMGGVGQVPHSLIGANKDAYIAFRCFADKEYRDIVERSAGMFRISSQLNKKLGDSLASGKGVSYTSGGKIVKGDLFAPGKEFMRREFMTPARVKASQDAVNRLLSSKIKIPRQLQFAFFDENVVSSVVGGNRNLISQAISDITSKGGKILELAEAGERVDISKELGWVESFTYSFEHIIDPVMPFHKGRLVYPAPMHDERVKDVMSRFGIAANELIRKFNPVKFMQRLKKLDPTFPTRVTDEAVFRVLSSAAIEKDVQNIADVLVGIGASEGAATILATEIASGVEAFAFVDNVSGFSFADKVMELVDRSRGNVARLVTPALVPKARVADLTTEFGLFLSIMEAIRTGEVRHVRVSSNRNTLGRIERHIFNKPILGDMVSLMRIFPE